MINSNTKDKTIKKKKIKIIRGKSLNSDTWKLSGNRKKKRYFEGRKQ